MVYKSSQKSQESVPVFAPQSAQQMSMAQQPVAQTGLGGILRSSGIPRSPRIPLTVEDRLQILDGLGAMFPRQLPMVYQPVVQQPPMQPPMRPPLRDPTQPLISGGPVPQPTLLPSRSGADDLNAEAGIPLWMQLVGPERDAARAAYDAARAAPNNPYTKPQGMNTGLGGSLGATRMTPPDMPQRVGAPMPYNPINTTTADALRPRGGAGMPMAQAQQPSMDRLMALLRRYNIIAPQEPPMVQQPMVQQPMVRQLPVVQQPMVQKPLGQSFASPYSRSAFTRGSRDPMQPLISGGPVPQPTLLPSRSGADDFSRYVT